MTICSHCLRPKVPLESINTLGKRLHQLRVQHCLTLKEVSNRTNISISHISLIEMDKRKPSIDNLLQLSMLFDIALNYLLKGM